MLFAAPALGEAELSVLDRILRARAELRWQLHEPRRWTGSLRRLSFARAIQGSNSIEGYDAVLDDAAAVAAGEEPLDAGAETRRALEGYRDAMTYVLQLPAEPDFAYSEQLLKSLHFMMTSFDLATRPGRWRAGTIYVRRAETGEVVHEGPDIGLVPELMRELVGALNADQGAPAVVTAAMAHLNLVMIHPFRDGNGRMARCLQSLVLARDGVLSPVFMSIEEYLGRNTQDYYAVLAAVGGGAWQPERDARPWLRFNLTAHLRQAHTMLQRAQDSETLWDRLERITDARGLPSRTINALFDAASGMRVRNATYRATLDEPVTEQTATRDLRQLVQAGLLVPRGEKRGRHYLAGPEVAALMRGIVAAHRPRDESDPFAA